MYGSLSNEGRIANALRQLNLPITVFCKLAQIPKTKFIQAMDGEPGCALSDETAQKALSFLERLFELQIAANELTKDANGLTTHLPLDWSRVDQISDALVIRSAQQICLETDDHTLDRVAENALKATTGGR